MRPDARLTGAAAAYPPAQPQHPNYDYYGAYGEARPPAYLTQQAAVASYPAAQPSYPVTAAVLPTAQAVSSAPQEAAPTAAPIPDLFSLLSSGALAGVMAAATTRKESAPASKPLEPSGARYGVAAAAKKGKPPSIEFSNASIKVLKIIYSTLTYRCIAV